MCFFKKKKSSAAAACNTYLGTGLLSVDQQLLLQPHVRFKVFPALLGVVGIDYWHGRVAVICLDLQEKKTHLVDKHL